MITIIFEHLNEKVLLQVEGNKVWFSTTTFGNVRASIEHLKLNYTGVVREFPDLEERDDWREEAIKRFKKNIESMKSEDDVSRYLINDLKKFNYIPLLKQKNGFRAEVIR